MSAAAATALPGRRKGDYWRAPWMEEGDWTATPNVLYEKLSRFLTQAQAAVLGLINRESTGRGREWTDPRLSEGEMADRLGFHKNSIGSALFILTEAGAIETKKVGRTRAFRLKVDEWKREPAKNWATRFNSADKKFRASQGVEDDEQQDEPEDDATLELAKSQIMVKVPGFKSHPLAQLDPESRLLKEFESGELQARLVSIDGTAVIPIPQTVESKDSAQAIETVNCLNPSPSVRLKNSPAVIVPAGEQKEKAADARDAAAAPPPRKANPTDPGFQEFFQFLEQRLSLHLGSAPPRDLVATEWRRLAQGGANLELFRTRFELRWQKFRSWGFLRLLVDDIVEACRVANTARQAEQSLLAAHDDQGLDDVYAQARIKLRDAIAKLSKRKGYDELLTSLKHIAGNLTGGRGRAHLDEVAMQLDTAEALMRNIAEKQTNMALRSEIESGVEAQLKPYKARHTKDQLQRMHALFFSRLLYDKHQLPKLSGTDGILGW